MGLPLISSRELEAALRRAGFTLHSGVGSHAVMKKPRPGGGLWVVTIVQGKKEIPRPTLKSILTQAGLSEAQFRALL